MANYIVRPKPGATNDGKNRKKATKKKAAGSDVMKGVEDDFNAAKTAADNLGITPKLDRLDTSADTAALDPNNPAYIGGRSKEMTDILDMMKQGLAGLSAPENTALREQAQRSLDQQYQTSLRQLQMSQARGGARGAAASAQQSNLDRQRMDEQNNLEQDLLVKNIDVQDQRRNAYQQALSGDEQVRAKKLQDAKDYLLKKQGINLDQSNAEQSSKLATISGILGYGTTKKNTAKEYNLAKQGMKRGVSTGTSSSGSSGGATDPLYNAIYSIGQQHYGNLPQI